MQDLHERELWQTAKCRAAFKRSLVAYVSVNSFLWCIYLFSGGAGGYPWPVWSMLGWGLGLGFQYLRAFEGADFFSTQKEYEKLKDSSPGNKTSF